MIAAINPSVVNGQVLVAFFEGVLADFNSGSGQHFQKEGHNVPQI
jgi:hypothetical protein